MRLTIAPPRAPHSFRVEVRVPRRACRRWHRRLTEVLHEQGHRVSIRLCEGPADDIPGLALLGFVERALYERRLRDEDDASAVIGIGDWVGVPAQEPPEIIFDCSTGDGPYPEGSQVLVPDFEGTRSLATLVAALTQHRVPSLGWRRHCDGALVASGRAALSSYHILTETLAQSLALMPALGARALSDPGLGAPALSPAIALRFAPAGPASVVRFGLATLADRLSHRLRETLTTSRQWNIGWRRVAAEQGLLATGRFDPTHYSWLARDAARYFADPFPFVHEGRLLLFCEEYPYATARGLISVMEWSGDGFGAPRPVLECAHHMSYPCVFHHGADVWMIPETTAAGTLELYRAVAFPDQWTLHCVIADGLNAADATLFEHAGLFWIAAGTATIGASDRDQMSLFFAEALEGPWQAHPLNPVVVDAFGARPAGHLQRTPAGWRRPAQDCSGGYGWGLSIRQIEHLDRQSFVETELARIPPPAVLDATGLHTVNVAGGIETIDALKP